MARKSSRQIGMLKNIFPGGSDSKASAYNAGDPGSIPGSGISPGERNGNPLQCSCQGNLMHKGVWWAIVHGITKQTGLSGSTTTMHNYTYITRHSSTLAWKIPWTKEPGRLQSMGSQRVGYD